MRKMFAITKRELLSFFVTPPGYIIFSAFMLLCAYFFFNLLGSFNFKLRTFSELPVQIASRRPNLNQWVIEPYYQTVMFLWVCLAPLLSMKSFADERSQSTLEMIFTSPLSIFQIVLGKFFALATIITLLSLGMLLFPLLLHLYGDPEFALTLSGFLAVYLSGLSFVSIGLLLSTLSRHQLLAGFMTFVLLLVIYFLHSFSGAVSGVLLVLVRALSPVLKASELTAGIITLSSLSYFLSFILIGILCTMCSLSVQRSK